MPDWSSIATRIAETTDQPFNVSRVQEVGGGCINAAAVLESGRHRYFVKYGASSQREMYNAEAAGLAALRATESVRVPQPVCWGANDQTAFLVMEYLPLRPAGSAAFALLGQKLTALHRTTQIGFGWHRHNTIGSTPQLNPYTRDWVEFFRDHRLGFQLRLAAGKGHKRLASKGERLLAGINAFFVGHRPVASLLHGDLWSGNVAATRDGEPVMFDPAVYFGDRETDIAMTRLFGGFSAAFYAAYAEAWSLASGHEVRCTLYNLYHLLNHLNLFGAAYLSRCECAIDQLLAEIK